MNTWVPVVTAGSFDAFVIGALVTAACFIAVVFSWRSFKREDAEWDNAPVAPGPDILRDDTPVRGPAPVAPDHYLDDTPVRGPAVVAFSPDRRPDEEPDRGQARGERVPAGPASRALATGLPDRGPWLPGSAAPASSRRQPRAGSHRAPHSLGDPTMAEGMPMPPGARRPPRHAAPSPRLSAKKSGASAGHSLPGGSHS
jgi:hypothetical protein